MTATCACGHVSITVSAKPKTLGVCHCLNCKRRTGSAFGMSSYFERTAVVSNMGQTSIYAFHHQAQNHDQERHFCARCGTTVYWYVSTMPDQIGIAGGCFAGEHLPEPSYSVNDSKRDPWVSLPISWDVWP